MNLFNRAISVRSRISLKQCQKWNIQYKLTIRSNISRVLRYRYKWLTSERFDNRYITDDLRTIDLIRTRQDKETVLPLNRRERKKYVPLSSVILIKSERTKLSKSVIFLSLATVKLITYILIDYCLYWVLNTIHLYGRFQSKVK